MAKKKPTKKDELVEIEVRLDPKTAEAVRALAGQGYLGDTPEAVIEHALRQYLFEQLVRTERRGA